MKQSPQDKHYLASEADDFFDRNKGGWDPKQLRPKKRLLLANVEKAGVQPKRVIEFGCAYGDLLNHWAQAGATCVGVEPSAKAVAMGKELYGDAVELHVGTVADNVVSADPAQRGSFDLIMIDDVFCWVSRETIFQSVANIDDLLADGGYLYIREFLPRATSRNANHHVQGEDVFCYKPIGPHLSMFTSSGIYEIVYQEVTMDTQDGWIDAQGADPFQSRWSDAILRKSYNDYFDA
jgi:SAM-dependent methyltransferase